MAFTPPIAVATKTDTGRVRAQNEDAVAASAEYGYAILADGMGGYRAGEVASMIAVMSLEAAFAITVDTARTESADADTDAARTPRIEARISDAIQEANAAILKVSHEEPECEGMGTTVVVAIVHGDSITIAHVGDSRAYRMRNGLLEQLTKDHSLLQEQIDAGLISVEDARLSVNRNLVTRAVGVESAVDVDVRTCHAMPGDLYLLCSDGLTDMVDDSVLREILAVDNVSLSEVCDALVERANNNGGHDNISVVLLHLLPGEPRAPTLIARVLNWLG